MDIISVVLGADTKKDRTRDSIKIIEYTFENYKMIDIGYMVHERFDKLVEETSFNVYKGINSNVTIRLRGGRNRSVSDRQDKSKRYKGKS